MRGPHKFFSGLTEELVSVLEHQVRYLMMWGHVVSSKEGDVQVNREDYNAAFGVCTPESPDVPAAAAHIWEWWWQLNSRRSPGVDALPPLSYTEIYYWSSLTRTQVTPVEIGIIVKLDEAFLRAVAVERTEQSERNKEK